MRTLVIGDLHLYSSYRQDAPGKLTAASRDLARLLHMYLQDGPVEVVLSGDIYDLAASGSTPVEERLKQIAGYHEDLHEALREVCRRGGRVIFVPGNHDYELAFEPAQKWLEAHVPGARVQPWFYRVRNVAHIEHGAQWDPDNAHPHPLLPQGDPLGVMLTRELLHRLGDLRLLDLNDRTPVPMLWHCFVNYGLRTPGMVARYIVVGLKASRRARLPDSAERAEAAARLSTFMQSAGVDEQTVHGMLAQSPRPTHTNGDVLFKRMYLDRTLLGVTALFTALGALATSSPTVALAAVGAAAVVGLVFGMYKNIYRGRVQDLLQAAAHRLAAHARVSYVIFGHAHKEYDDAPYLNPGSFAFPQKRGMRAFVEIDGEQARLRYLQAGGALVPVEEKDKARAA